MVDGGPQLDSCDSDDDGENNPMVSMAVRPFWLPVVLTAWRCWSCDTLIDSDCTRCLMSLATTAGLGFRVRKLSRPIRFEQVDGSLLGGAPATHVTERVKLEFRQHWELIHFVVVSRGDGDGPG